MSKLPSSRFMSSGLLVLLVAGTAASSVACSKEEEQEKKQAWSCMTTDVPAGEVIRCTQSAATADGPVGGELASGATADGTSPTEPSGSGAAGSLPYPTTTEGATTDGTTGDTTYDCGPEAYGADCPTPDATTGGAGGSEAQGNGNGNAGGNGNGTNNGSEGTSTSGDATGGAGSTGGGTGAAGGGNSSSNTSDGTSTNGNGNGGAGSNAGGSKRPGPDECAFVPDLDYCAGATSDGASTSGTGTGGTGGTGTGTGTGTGGTGTGTGTGTGSGTGGTGGADGSGGTGESDCTNPRGVCSPGQDKKDGTSDGTSTSGSGNGSGTGGGATSGSGTGGGATSGSGSKGTGKSWKCTKDKKGNKSCVSTPDCATGTHPSACGACVPDGEGANDCVPQSEGGCWVTGGGYVIAPSTAPAAAADGHDNFGGNAKPMKKGYISGHWNHVDHGTGNHAKGRPEYIHCRTVPGLGPKQPGGKKGMTTNQVYFGGHAQWRDKATGVWADGYWFDVVANDHGEPGRNDKYKFSIRQISNVAAGQSGTLVYETQQSLLTGGNIQIHPSNNGHPAVQSPLPAWVTLEP